MNNAFPLPPHDWPEFIPGMVWLCGAGPGDAGLLTLHALNGLQQADVIVYDALVGDDILNWAANGVDLVYAGKRGGKPSPKQADITLRLIELAQAGKRVLRLKGGDPFVFGRGGEEAQKLIQAGVTIRIIPGISAGIGGLAYAGIPLTHRDVNQAVTFITGHDQTGQAPQQINWQAISDGAPVLVIYMGMKHLEKISTALLAAGRPNHEPVAIVCNASTPNQQVLETTLSNAVKDAKNAGMKPPSIICVGQNVPLRHVLNWAQ